VDPKRKAIETKGAHIITLMFSAAKGDLDAVFRLHLSGMDMGLHDYDGRTALHLAACEGHYEICEYLLKQCGVHHISKDR
jgi:glutaminase